MRYNGSEPIIHMGGRRYIPGETYVIPLKDWYMLQANKSFELLSELPKAKNVKIIGAKKPKKKRIIDRDTEERTRGED